GKARSAAFRALQINPQLAEAEASLGLIRSLHDWEWMEAEKHFRRSMDLNPGYASAAHWFALDHLALLGRFEEAADIIDGACHLDPLSPILREGRGYVAMLAGHYGKALEHFREVVEMDQYFYKGYTSMGRLYIQKKMYPEAIAKLEKGRSLAGDIPTLLAALGQAHGLAGNEMEARRLLARLAEISEQRYVPSTCFAIVQIGLGENAKALDYLETGCAQHELPMAALKVHPVYDSLRSERRFTGLITRIGLDR
ncbi:MAG: tetratricopeptide repeat protein, partial [Bryobacteraceae bacterium]